MSRVVILGATGMLGSAVYALAEDRALDVLGTTTDLRHAPDWCTRPLIVFDGSAGSLEAAVDGLGEGDHVINCVGLIKHRIDESSISDRERAVALNSELPHRLAALAEGRGFDVLQIATDCVYSGRRGAYTEEDPYDADDVYGMTKALGEVPSPRMMHIRSSIIGRELRHHRSLIDWAMLQPRGSSLSGYTDHLWNGVTTVAFARVALGVVTGGGWRAGTSHLVPSDAVSKYEILRHASVLFGRQDLQIEPVRTGVRIDRTLATVDPAGNRRLWAAGGYSSPPSIAVLVEELAVVQGEGVGR